MTIPVDRLALWLVRNPLKGKRGPRVDLGPESSEADCARYFLEQFTPKAILGALSLEGEPIGIRWIVAEYLTLYHEKGITLDGKLKILEKLRSLHRLAALQEPKLASEMEHIMDKKDNVHEIQSIEGGVAAEDPFLVN
jgi:hypothetical protein